MDPGLVIMATTPSLVGMVGILRRSPPAVSIRIGEPLLLLLDAAAAAAASTIMIERIDDVATNPKRSVTANMVREQSDRRIMLCDCVQGEKTGRDSFEKRIVGWESCVAPSLVLRTSVVYHSQASDDDGL
jgi:hypothetical protein